MPFNYYMQSSLIQRLPYFLLYVLILNFCCISLRAESVGYINAYDQISKEKQSTKSSGIQKNKINKKIFRKPFNKKNDALGAFIFWWVLMPAVIITLLALSFALGPFNLFYWILGLSAFSIWAAVSGVVYFPLQMIGFPTGAIAIVVGLILKNLIIWTAGLAILTAAALAFAYMAIMFTFGTRKYQPK
jgi:hypothetical protein